MNKKNVLKIVFMALTALVAWFAIFLQVSISFPVLLAQGKTYGWILLRLLSYFTILSNLSVAISLTLPLINPAGKWGKYFSSASVNGAITVYITVVCITYNTVLRKLVVLEGPSIIANELLHVVVPILYVLYWFIFAARTRLKWNNLYCWLAFPFVYLIYILIRGAITNEYPYPFVDVSMLGYANVAVNSLVMVVVFGTLSALFILANRLMYSIDN